MDHEDKNLLEFARDYLRGQIQVTQDNRERIHRLMARGLLEPSGNRYRLTEAGKSAIKN